MGGLRASSLQKEEKSGYFCLAFSQLRSSRLPACSLLEFSSLVCLITETRTPVEGLGGGVSELAGSELWNSTSSCGYRIKVDPVIIMVSSLYLGQHCVLFLASRKSGKFRLGVSI